MFLSIVRFDAIQNPNAFKASFEVEKNWNSILNGGKKAVHRTRTLKMQVL